MIKLEDFNFTFLKRVYIFVFIGLIVLLVSSIFSNNDIRGVESNVIYTIQEILDDNSLLYQNPETFPFAITQYSPLYYLICDAVLSILPIDSSDFLMIRIISRLISIGFLLLTCYMLITLFIKQFKLSRSIGIFFVSLLIIFSFPWYSISRPDILLLFFLVLTIYCMFIYLQNHNGGMLLIMGICSFLAIASKQNGVILPGVVGLFFVINKNWKGILLITLGFIIGGVVTYLILLFGDYNLMFLKRNIVDGVHNKLDFIYALKGPYLSFVIYFGLFFISFYYITYQKFKTLIPKRNSISFFLKFTILVFLVISAISALKIGSGVNYFNEVVVLMLISLAYHYSIVRPDSITHKKLYFGSLLLVGIQICLVQFYYYPMKIMGGIHETYLSENSVREDIKSYLTANLNGNYFFSDDRKINLAMHERCILPQFEIHQASLDYSVFDYRKLKKDFLSGHIKFLVLYTQKRPILNMNIDSLYHFDRKIGHLNIYKFKADLIP